MGGSRYCLAIARASGAIVYHMEGADGFVVAGYTACVSCGGQYVTNGKRRCEPCRKGLVLVGEAAAVAKAATRPASSRPSRARKPRKLSAAERTRKRMWNRARSNALTRLRQIHPELYEVLLAEEKAKLGLDPHLDSRPANIGPLERELSSA
jgi:hypothetical protein